MGVLLPVERAGRARGRGRGARARSDARARHLTAPAFEAVALPAARECAQRLVIDLSEVSFLASAGIAVVLAAGTEAPGKVHVVAGSGFTRRPLEITGAGEVVHLFATREEALADG